MHYAVYMLVNYVNSYARGEGLVKLFRYVNIRERHLFKERNLTLLRVGNHICGKCKKEHIK